MVNEPALKPICCGQFAKWVEVSHSLKYHYCEVCKNEVVVNKRTDSKEHLDWGNLFDELGYPKSTSKVHGGTDASGLAPMLGGGAQTSVPTLPKGAKINPTNDELDQMVKDALKNSVDDDTLGYDYFPGNWGADLRKKYTPELTNPDVGVRVQVLKTLPAMFVFFRASTGKAVWTQAITAYRKPKPLMSGLLGWPKVTFLP